MSLLGRLEDLSLPDIIQIVFLSRRTGMLEIVDGSGRSTVMFHHGLIVDATSPADTGLEQRLRELDVVTEGNYAEIHRIVDMGAPLGTALTELGLVTVEDLATIVRDRVVAIVSPLLVSRDGEFNFILSDSIAQFELPYDPDTLFREGGISPASLLGAPEGEKMKPLRGLEESMKVGKALLSGRKPAEAPPKRAEIPTRPAPPRTEAEALDSLMKAPPPEEPPAGAPVAEDAEPFATEPAGSFSFAPLEADEEVLSAAGEDEPLLEAGGDLFGLSSPEALTGVADLGEMSPSEIAGRGEAAPSRMGTHAPEEPIEESGEPLDELAGLSVSEPFEDQQDEAAEHSTLPFPEPAPEPEPEPAQEAEPVSEEIEIPEDAFVPAPAAPVRRPLGVVGETIVLYEPDPLLRVAARRAFTKKGFEFLQFGNLADTRDAVHDLLRQEKYFVTFLDLAGSLAGADSPELLLGQIKAANRKLPVVMIDREADLRRRHDLLDGGADFYLTKPSAAHLQPGLAEETLGLFADELMLYAERAFESWGRASGMVEEADRELSAGEAGERTQRSFALLKRLISELTDPDDLDQVSQTILRMAEEYLERGALFAVGDNRFTGLGGFGETGAGDEMSRRVRRITIEATEQSVLETVNGSRQPHRGKIQRTPANERLLAGLGPALPSEVVVLPIVHRDRVVGLLYGDNATTRHPLQDVAGLEIFLGQAGLAFENALVALGRRRAAGTTE